MVYASHLLTHKICPRCKKNLPIAAFIPRGDGTKQVTSWCQQCFSDYAKEKGAERYALIAAIKHMSGCIDCGYNDHPAALEFDHRPGTVKLFNISRSYRRKWEVLMAEIAKCDVRCANCHAVITVERKLADVGTE